MRAWIFLAWSLAATAACSGPTGDTAAGLDDGGADGALPAVPPAHNACTGAATTCLSGTASTTQSLAAPQRYVANLYELFPLAGASPVAKQEVALDGTWAFSGLPTGGHYYVYVVAVYGEADGSGGTSIAATVGPLAVPSSGQPVDVVVQPAQLSVLESSVAGGALEIRSALAYLFDPSTGAPSTGSETVSITVGGTSVPMPWTAVTSTQYGYYATFASATPAQSTYTIKTSTASWQLVGTAPTFTPSLTAPASGAKVPSGQALVVSWSAQPTADEELVYVYTQASGGTWTPVNASPPPVGPGVTQTTIPGSEIVAGSLLIGDAFVVGSCPASADGCIVAEAVANAQITAQ
jgi:hypothetical protein